MEIDGKKSRNALDPKVQAALLDNMYHDFCILFLDNAPHDTLMAFLDKYIEIISDPSLHQRLMSFRYDVEDLLQSKK